MSKALLHPNWHRVAGLKPRLKPGVTMAPHRYLGELWYVLADAETAQHHRFTATAAWIIGAFDGTATVDAIWREGLEMLGEEAPGQGAMVQLLMQLNNADLLLSDVVPVVQELQDRFERHRKAKRAKVWRNPLVMTLPLVDPDAALERAARLVARVPGLFWWGLFFSLVVPAAFLLVANQHRLAASLTDQLLSAQSLIMLVLVAPLVKLWHEIGHGIVTRLHGGRVPEAGVMLMAFYPLPYVDASASLAFRSKWRRIHVAAAGMLFDIALASAALMLWLVMEDGVTRSALYSIILICGVSTVAINGNPLLRYDGYYMLCDALEIANLGTRANRFWGQLAERWAFGAKDLVYHRATRRETVAFVLYAPLAFIYRTVIALVVALFVAQHYLAAGVALAVWSLALTVVWPAIKALKSVFFGERLAAVRGRAVAVTLAGLSICGLALAAPLPHATISQGVVWLPEEVHVRAGAGGFVAGGVMTPGTMVAPGDLLLTATDPKLTGEIAVRRLKLAEAELALATEQFGDQAKTVLLRRERDDALIALTQLEERAARLEVRARAAGRFVAAKADDLPGRYFQDGALIGHVVPETTSLVRVVVTQADIGLVRHATLGVAVRLADETGRTRPARIVREVPAGANELPSAALASSGGGMIVADPKDESGVKALDRVFQFDLALDEPVGGGFGRRAHVKFSHDPESLLARWGRRARQVFLSQFQV